MLHSLYLSTDAVQQAIIAQDKVIRKLQMREVVIVGRAADYVLREYKNVVNIFVYAPAEYRIQRVMQVYGDTLEEAKKNIRHSDEARSAYYKNISGQSWGERHNYDLLIDSSVGAERCAAAICQYLMSINSKMFFLKLHKPSFVLFSFISAFRIINASNTGGYDYEHR